NDSKATNYDAAEVALEALPGPLMLLAGGEAKQGDASGWVEQIKRQAAAVVLFGAAGPFFQGLLQRGGYGGRVAVVADLEQAVALASAWATALNQSPDSQGCQAVLLSPACASFDQYSDFEARGDHFRQLVHALATGAST
ncbi:MAG: cyanophycin synthetase, partial [Synechococcus sp. ELA619]